VADSTAAKASICCDSDPEQSKRDGQNVFGADQQKKETGTTTTEWSRRRDSCGEIDNNRHEQTLLSAKRASSTAGEDSRGFRYWFFRFRYLAVLVKCFGEKERKRRRFGYARLFK